MHSKAPVIPQIFREWDFTRFLNRLFQHLTLILPVNLSGMKRNRSGLFPSLFFSQGCQAKMLNPVPHTTIKNKMIFFFSLNYWQERSKRHLIWNFPQSTTLCEYVPINLQFKREFFIVTQNRKTFSGSLSGCCLHGCIQFVTNSPNCHLRYILFSIYISN